MKRLKNYELSTRDLVEYYKGMGVLKSFAGTESKVIYKDIFNLLENIKGTI
jgi:hypothetical protein